jgi:hemerythrin superfamily protein
MIQSGTDVVSFLKEQHQQIREGFTEVQAATGAEREAAFYALRRLLAVHETAEEEIVHPAARRRIPNGEDVVRARLHEENEAKQVLAALEDMPVDSQEFERMFGELELAVVAHAAAEEREEFEVLSSTLDQSRLESMQRAVNFMESVAPTRPHPGVESATANLLVGPFASMLDRARDALSGKS